MNSFADVDGAADPDRFFRYLDEVARLPFVATYRSRMRELLALETGWRVLDVGCGLGDEARAIAAAFGVRVSAVDASELMIAEARRRTDREVEYWVADAAALPFADGAFQAVRIERVLHWLDSPEAAVDEIARVTVRGGRVVACEPDFDSLVIASSRKDITKRILAASRNARVTQLEGRELSRLLRAAGFRVTEVEAFGGAVRDLELARILFEVSDLAGAAVEAGAIDEDESRAWLADLEASAERGDFAAAMLGFVVRGDRD